jgi:hypothetical protein
MKFDSLFTRLTLTLLLGSVLTACGSDSSSVATHSLNNVEYATVSEGTLAHNGTNITGTGSVVFVSPLSGITSNNSFALQFTLSDGGGLTLAANSNNQTVNGLELVFTRSGTQLTMATQVGETFSTSTPLTGVDASGTIQLQIDVHNSESPAHVLVWTGNDFAEASAIYNSESPGPAAAGNGTGTFWGLALSNATVTGATVGTPKFTE